MAQSVLPNSINYDQMLPSLIPGVQNFSYVVQPNNGSSFKQGQTIQLDLGNRGFLDPKSLYIRYKMTVAVTADTTNPATICGFPALAPFSRLDTIVGGQSIDAISDYNVVAHTWSNTNMSVADKYGLQYNLGYRSPTGGSIVPIDELDGRYLGATVTAAAPVVYYISVPLVCSKLANADKFIPLFACPAIRITLTLDNIANYISIAAADTGKLDITKTTIENFELVYDMIDFGPEIERMTLAKEMLTIKTSGYNNSAVSVPATAQGTQQYVFNQRFASIRSAILLPSGAGIDTTKVANGKFDSLDISTNGTYQLNIGGVSFPQAPLNCAYNKAGLMSELRKTVSNLYNYEKGFSISSLEFGYVEASATTPANPGKFYVPFDLNKINNSSNNLLNGTSSQNSPINAIINYGPTATAAAKNLYLILNYDCILTIDVRNKQINQVM